MSNPVKILIMFLKPEKATEPASPLVPFLQKFAEPRNKKPSVSIFSNNIFDRNNFRMQLHSINLLCLTCCVKVLKLELKQIREQQDLLFRFMNFLKQEGAVHVLQFCLTVGEASLYILL